MEKTFERWSGQGGYREVLIIAIPLILSTGALSVQYFVDRMFLSWYSPQAIAAAMPAGILNFSIMSFFIGTATYASAFVAQYFGAGRYHRIGPVLWQGLYIALIGGTLMALLHPLAPRIFGLIGHDPLVQGHEIDYFSILCLGGFPVIASAAMAGFFSGRGRPWPVMAINFIITIINIILTYLMVFGHGGFPEMGIAGAGIATVTANTIGFMAYAAILSHPAFRREFRTLAGWRPDRELFARFLRFGLPSGVHFFLDMAGFTAFILLVGRLGTDSLAATNIAFNINTLAFMPMIGFGIAVSVLVGQYLGGDRPDLASRSVYSGLHMTFLYMTGIALAYVVVPELFVRPFTPRTDPESFAPIFALTVVLLRFVAVYSVFDTLNIIFSSAIRGAGDTRFVMFVIMFTSVFGLIIPTYLAIVVFQSGLMTPWLIVSAYVIVLGFVFYARFRTGEWKTMRVIESGAVSQD
ncbi:MAG: MATE family efflux transporter [Proteobacteria bacterium]|nr:MATE family efflux transporter [Pseudomonadota bacterium]